MATQVESSRAHEDVGGNSSADQILPSMECICNLCECGNHRCADYSSPTRQLLAASERQNRGLSGQERELASGQKQLKDNSMDPYNRKSHDCLASNNERYLVVKPLDSKPKRDVGARGKGRGSGVEVQRKSHTPQVPLNLSHHSPFEGDEDDVDRLVHVLVTKPTVASKPKDNIVFEGDMDLKTTFETSYEALAKMRLDCWKKYQAAKGRFGQDSPINRDADLSPASGRFERSLSKQETVDEVFEELNDVEESRDRRESQQLADDVSVLDRGSRSNRYSNNVSGRLKHNLGDTNTNRVTSRTSLLGETTATQETLDSRQRRSFSSSSASSSSFAASKMADWQASSRSNGFHDMAAGSNRYQQSSGARELISWSPSRQTRSIGVGETASGNDARIEPRDLKESLDADTPTSIQRSPNDVDPDLKPIIVYDANLNRLERVGLRKRSKYRPSTSLRSGARGMFGDQEEEPSAAANAMDSEATTKRREVLFNSRELDPSQTKAAAGKSTPVHKSLDFGDNHQESYNFDPPDSGTNEALNRRTRQTLAARNLRGSTNQANYLTYSQQNLPIDSKRKLRDNINMTDHIRDQNIVASSKWPTGGRDTAEGKHQQSAMDGQVEMSAEDQLLGEDLLQEEELQRLTELEEAAAVEEIQRATGSLKGPQISSEMGKGSRLDTSKASYSREANSTTNGHSPVMTNSGPTDQWSRQTRLQKTCQQQNFYINQNEYPEPRMPTPNTKIAASSPKPDSSAATSGMSPLATRANYKNLFRESPDFMLTTGRFLDKESRESHENEELNRQLDGALNIGDKRRQPTSVMAGDRGHNMESGHVSNRLTRDSVSPASHTNVGCRVLKLEDEYEFVRESHSGHKYFVQKPASPVK